MRKVLILMLSASLLIVASCKKSPKDEDQTQKTCNLTQSTFTSTGGDSGKASYTYDDKERVISAKYDGSDLDQYTYSNDQITLKTNDGIITTYKLGSTGMITTETYSDTPSKIEYTYNMEGYLIQETETNGANISITKYTYSNGNLTGVDYGTDKLVIAYTNDSKPTNFFTDADADLPSFSTGILQHHFGKTSKNLVSKTTYNSSYSEAYTYDKDANGNVTKVTMKTNDNGGFTVNNTFDCK